VVVVGAVVVVVLSISTVPVVVVDDSAGPVVVVEDSAGPVVVVEDSVLLSSRMTTSFVLALAERSWSITANTTIILTMAILGERKVHLKVAEVVHFLLEP